HQSLISRSSVAHQSLISRSSVAHQSLISQLLWLPVRFLLFLVFAPVNGLMTVWGHLALWLNWGSPDDPLGYTIEVRK
ncbi:MAG: hypothetical protein LH609_19810, partial [Rudanella sp.]|nr:hypothetical protein [Rudanella sp.]